MVFIKKLLKRAVALDKRIKFVFVGGLNTVIGYGVNALMLRLVFAVPWGADALLSQISLSSTTGHIAGMINGYFCNKYFTFERKKKSLTEFLRFAVVSLAQLALSVFLQKFIQDTLSTGIYAAMAITLVITTVLSYLGHNYFTFRACSTDKGNDSGGNSDVANTERKNDSCDTTS